MVRNPEGLIRFKIDALRYLQTASLNGNVNAMIALAQHYKDGLIMPNDVESAYAYTYAAERTNLFGPLPVLQSCFISMFGGPMRTPAAMNEKKR